MMRKVNEMIIIRPINRTDIPEIAKLETECFSIPWSEKDIKDSLGSTCEFLAAEENGTILGYCGIQISDGGYITNVAVKQNERRRGIGRLLMQGAIKLTKEKGLPFLTLEVRISNTPAIALYEALGFMNLGKRPNFYSNPREDAYIYTLYFKKD